jgi:hypothetical protein
MRTEYGMSEIVAVPQSLAILVPSIGGRRAYLRARAGHQPGGVGACAVVRPQRKRARRPDRVAAAGEAIALARQPAAAAFIS